MFKFFIFLTTKNKNKIISGKSSRFIPPISNPKFGGMRRESAKIYIDQNRPDLVQIEEAQADFISTFLPEQLTNQEIEAIV